MARASTRKLPNSAPPRAVDIEHGFGVLAFVALTAFTFPIAHYRMFVGFARYDDEGYMLLSLKTFLDHAWHYSGIDGYGPLYYEFWGAVFTPLRIPIDHDHGRIATVAVWLLASLLIGLGTWGMTGSILLGLAAQLSAFEALYPLAGDSMHPGGIIAVLLAAILVLSCFVDDRPSRAPVALLGGAVMALILIKVNAGVFAAAGVALVGVLSYPILARRRWLRLLVEAGFVALPLVLMNAKLGEAWVRHYALHVCAAALAVVIALRARPIPARDVRELWWFGGGFLAMGTIVTSVLLTTGTSPSAIVDGVILRPLRLPGLVSIPLDPGRSWNDTAVLDLLAVAGVLGYRYALRRRGVDRSRTWVWSVSTVSIVVGVLMAFPVINSITRFTLEATIWAPTECRWAVLAFAWVALIGPPGTAEKGTRFARLLMPPLAVLQALYAYPVAGSQAFLSMLFVIPVGALCIANGVGWIAFGRAGSGTLGAPLKARVVAVAVALIVVVCVHLNPALNAFRAAYYRSVPLGLTGAYRVRVSPDEAATLQAVVGAINAHCRAFVMLPEWNSFYLWTRQEPPAGYEPIGWAMALDTARQQRAVEALRSVDGLCLLEDAPGGRAWANAESRRSAGPMERYLRHGFVPVARVVDYQLLKRDDG